MPAGTAFLIKEGMLSKTIKNVDANSDGVVDGYLIGIRNQMLHSIHPLGWIRKLELTVDGEAIAADKMWFILRGQWISVAYMPTIQDIFWKMMEPADIYVVQPGGIGKGSHRVSCTITASTLEETSILDKQDAWPRRSMSIETDMAVEEEGNHGQ